MTQKDTILHHLKRYKRSGLTSKEAIDRYGCTRLSAVIRTLRDEGNDIRSVREAVVGRYGTVSIARYYIK